MTRARARLAVVPDRPLRVVYYIRVSQVRGRQGDDFHSPEVQLSWMRRKTIGTQEVEVIDCDIDVPGGTFEREGIERVKQLAEQRAFDVLCVYRVDRFGRNTLESLKMLNWLADKGITIMSAKENVDTTTPAGRKHLTDLLAGAQMRREEIGENWSDTIDERAQNGEHHGHRLFGYHKVKKRMVSHPLHGPIMEGAFIAYAEGERLKVICERIYALTGRKATPKLMKERLRNPVYLGKVVAAGEELPGNHTPLVSAETWELVQARLAHEAGLPPRVRVAGWSLSGLLFCTQGCRVQQYPSARRGSNGEQIRRLICGQAKSEIVDPCPGIGSPAMSETVNAVLKQVEIHVSNLLTDAKVIAEFAERRAFSLVETGRLKTQLASTRTAMTKLTLAHARGSVPEAAFDAAMAELVEGEQAIQRELAVAKQGAEATSPIEVANAAQTLLKLWPEMDEYERHGALAAVVKRVVIRRAARWREPVAARIEIDFW